MGILNLDELDWVRSPSSESETECVEVAGTPLGGVAVRKPCNHSVALYFTEDEWRAFLDGARKGEFDGFVSLPA